MHLWTDRLSKQRIEKLWLQQKQRVVSIFILHSFMCFTPLYLYRENSCLLLQLRLTFVVLVIISWLLLKLGNNETLLQWRSTGQQTHYETGCKADSVMCCKHTRNVGNNTSNASYQFAINFRLCFTGSTTPLDNPDDGIRAISGYLRLARSFLTESLQYKVGAWSLRYVVVCQAVRVKWQMLLSWVMKNVGASVLGFLPILTILCLLIWTF